MPDTDSRSLPVHVCATVAAVGSLHACFDLEHPRLAADAATAPSDSAASGGAMGLSGMSGASAGAPGASGAGGAAGTDSCVDPALALCMRVSWPSGIVPYRRGMSVDDDTWDMVTSGIEYWQGAPVLGSQIDFVAAPAPVRPWLVFAAEPGCGLLARSADEVTVAVGSCIDERDVAREVGVALGLPRVQQRSDRDRYLLMADESAFDCSRGQYFDSCPSGAEIGPFSVQSILFTPANSRMPPSVCGLEPRGDYLYLLRDVPYGEEVSSCESRVGRPAMTVSWIGRDHAALAELYATTRGWSPFRPVARDLGADRPWERSPSDVSFAYRPVIVQRPGGALSVFDWVATTNSMSLWRAENDGSGWTGWLRGPRPPEIGAFGLIVSDQGAVDIVVVGAGIHRATLDGELEVGWISLGPNPLEIEHLLATTNYGFGQSDEADIVLYAHHIDAGGQDLFVSRVDGTTWSGWESLPVDFAPATAPAGLNTAGTEHVVVPRSDAGLGYTSRAAPDATWTPWIRLPGALGRMTGAQIGRTASGTLVVVASDGGRVWQQICDDACSSPTSWSSPELITGDATFAGGLPHVALSASNGALDLVAISADTWEVSSPRVWHKHWAPMQGSAP